MKITILGIGRSGTAAAILALKKGMTVFVSDISPAEKLTAYVKRLESAGIEYETGGHSDRVYDAELCILSPGIPSTVSVVAEMRRRRIPVISEIEFASRQSNQPFIGITGSNGKTTTTTLLGRMLEAAFGGERCGGNIGTALSEVIDPGDTLPIAVELSSFQLETIDRFSPDPIIWLNVSPNHLDWYDTYADYVAAKARILKNATESTRIIFNKDDPQVTALCEAAPGEHLSFSLRGDSSAWVENESIYLHNKHLLNVSELTLSGPHHLQNMMAAALAADEVGVDHSQIRNVCVAFRGLAHRTEWLGQWLGCDVYNDSKSTSVAALEMALRSFPGNIHLICGGKHKGAGYEPLSDLIESRVKRVYLIGEAAPVMANAWSGRTAINLSETVDRAVDEMEAYLVSGDVILFSPACSSYDQFKNYEVRGAHFKTLIAERIGGVHAEEV